METPDKSALKHKSIGKKCKDCNYWHDANCGRCCKDVLPTHRREDMPACINGFEPMA